MSNAKYAIIKAKIEGILNEIMVKTHSDYVVIQKGDSEVSLTSMIAEILASLGTKDSAEEVNAKILALKQEMLGDVPVEAYNTFTELAQYIEEHKDVADALTEAIGKKADAATVEQIQQTLAGLGSLATKSVVSEADLDAELKGKVSDAYDARHSHENKDVLDGITAEKVGQWDKAQENAIEKITVNGTEVEVGENKTVAIEMPVVHVGANEPANMKDGDVWLHVQNPQSTQE